MGDLGILQKGMVFACFGQGMVNLLEGRGQNLEFPGFVGRLDVRPVDVEPVIHNRQVPMATLVERKASRQKGIPVRHNLLANLRMLELLNPSRDGRRSPRQQALDGWNLRQRRGKGGLLWCFIRICAGCGDVRGRSQRRNKIVHSKK